MIVNNSIFTSIACISRDVKSGIINFDIDAISVYNGHQRLNEKDTVAIRETIDQIAEENGLNLSNEEDINEAVDTFVALIEEPI